MYEESFNGHFKSSFGSKSKCVVKQQHFDSIWEMATYGRDTEIKRGRNLASTVPKDSSKHGDFAGSESFEAACKIAGDGWTKGAERMRSLLSDLERHLPEPDRPRTEMRTRRSGAVVDMPKYLRGEPEHMRRPEHVGSNAVGKSIEMRINFCASCGVTANELFNRGAMLGATVLALEDQGYSVEVSAADTTQCKGNTVYEPIVRLKRADGYLDVDEIAFALAHPCMLRRISFRAMEVHEDPAIHGVSGYGTPIDHEDHEADLYYSAYGQMDGGAKTAVRAMQRGDMARAVEWVQEQIEAVS